MLRLDHPKRFTADTKAQRCLYGGDISARRAINMVTQRCLSGIGTSAPFYTSLNLLRSLQPGQALARRAISGGHAD